MAAVAVAGTNAEQIIAESCNVIGTVHRAVAMNDANKFMEAFGDCASNGLIVRLKDGTGGTWGSSYASNSGMVPRDVRAMFTASKAYVFYTNSAAADELELIWSSSPTAAAATPGATATVSGLVGFDVDPTGGTAIARYASGATVGVFSGQTLGTPIQTVATDCNRDSGVTAFTLNVAYVTCDPDDNSADFLRIRTNALEHITSVPLNQCDSDHPIHAGEDDYSLNPDPEAYANEVRTFQLLSLDFTQAQDAQTGTTKYCRLQAAFGTSFETGKVGVLTADAAKCINNNCQTGINLNRRIASAWSQYDPSSNPISHMCAVLPMTIPGQSSSAVVAAVDDSGTLKIYTWNRDTFSPQVTLAESAAGIFSQGKGVGCGKGDRILVETSTQLAAFNVTSQGIAWTPKTLPSVPPQRGVAMSYDGKWGAFVNGTNVQLVNMTNGATPACGAIRLPGGTFKELRLTEKAQNLYMATSTTIERWDITSCTTGTAQGEGSFDDGCGPTSPTACPGVCPPTCPTSSTSTSGGLFDVNSASVPEGFTVAAFKGLLGLFLVIGVAAGLFFIASGSVALGVVGAGVGYLMALFFGLLPLWPIIVVGVLGLAVVFIKMRSGG